MRFLCFLMKYLFFCSWTPPKTPAFCAGVLFNGSTALEVEMSNCLGFRDVEKHLAENLAKCGPPETLAKAVDFKLFRLIHALLVRLHPGYSPTSRFARTHNLQSV